MKPPTAAEMRALGRRAAIPRGLLERMRSRGETLAVFDGGGATAGATAQDIEAGNAWMSSGAGRNFAGGSTAAQVTVVVPDGVARVVFYAPRQSFRGLAGAPVYRSSIGVDTDVHGNVAAVQINRACCDGPLPMVWYDAADRVIKRLGDFKSRNRVVPPAKPGPETAQSRAAEKDPSTPNRVWVTPATGTPHIEFTVHFRVLIRDADYGYRLTGPRCPQLTPSGGGGGANNDVRGRIWSERVKAVAAQRFCSGTYRISAVIMDLGRNGQLRHPAQPFGSATFTVR